MYSQHISEKPVHKNPTPISHFISRHRHFSLKAEIKKMSKPIKSVCAIILSVVLFVGSVMCAYCLEGTGDVGFKPDFQNNKPSYSSNNALFASDKNAVSVKLTVHGNKEFTAKLNVSTVKEVIEEFSIALCENDVVNYALDEKVFDGMEITVDRITTETYTHTVTAPYTTTTRESQTVPCGTKKVIQAGKDGSVTETVTETYKNGILTGTEVYTDAENSTDPVEEIIEVGVGGVYTDSYGKSYEYSYYMDVTATAYGTLSGITATGKPIDFGMIAVDPKVIPLGTKVYITGSTYGDMGVHTAEDTGGGIKGNKIDIFLGDDYNTLMQFGRRTMRIYILK